MKPKKERRRPAWLDDVVSCLQRSNEGSQNPFKSVLIHEFLLTFWCCTHAIVLSDDHLTPTPKSSGVYTAAPIIVIFLSVGGNPHFSSSTDLLLSSRASEFRSIEYTIFYSTNIFSFIQRLFISSSSFYNSSDIYIRPV